MLCSLQALQPEDALQGGAGVVQFVSFGERRVSNVAFGDDGWVYVTGEELCPSRARSRASPCPRRRAARSFIGLVGACRWRLPLSDEGKRWREVSRRDAADGQDDPAPRPTPRHTDPVPTPRHEDPAPTPRHDEL
jgi:hypothetical protein